MVQIDISGAKKLSPAARRRLKNAALAALEVIPSSHSAYRIIRQQEWLLHLQFVSPKQIHELNVRFRSKDKPTDVLSFPMWNTEWKQVEEQGPALIGEIFICESVARKQCTDFDNTPLQELERLTIHGTLHVLDYDHERGPKDARIMFGLEAKAVAKTRS